MVILLVSSKLFIFICLKSKEVLWGHNHTALRSSKSRLRPLVRGGLSLKTIMK